MENGSVGYKGWHDCAFCFLYFFLLYAVLSLYVLCFSWLRGWDLYDAVYLWLVSMEDKDEKVFDLSLA
jgi:hypothetical protein